MVKLVLVGSREGAEILGISRSSFNRAVSNGKVKPAAKFPGLTGAYAFNRAELEDIARKGKVQ